MTVCNHHHEVWRELSQGRANRTRAQAGRLLHGYADRLCSAFHRAGGEPPATASRPIRLTVDRHNPVGPGEQRFQRRHRELRGPGEHDAQPRIRAAHVPGWLGHLLEACSDGGAAMVAPGRSLPGGPDRTLRILQFLLLLQAFAQALALQAREIVHEQLAIQMIDFVLDANGQQPIRLQIDFLAVAI